MPDQNMPAAGLPTYFCPKVATPPVIDGRPDDEAWSKAPVGSLSMADTGDSPTRATTFSMCWDDDNLYIIFECEDPEIWATYTERDDPLYEQDVVEVFLDPNNDPVDYFELEFSPRGVIFDARFDAENPISAGDIKKSVAWNCEGMRVATTIDGDIDDVSTHRGWTCEIAVPFAGLGLKTPSHGEAWRGNLYRIDYKPLPEEYQAWSPTIVVNFHTLARFGNIVFTEGNME